MRTSHSRGTVSTVHCHALFWGAPRPPLRIPCPPSTVSPAHTHLSNVRVRARALSPVRIVSVRMPGPREPLFTTARSWNHSQAPPLRTPTGTANKTSLHIANFNHFRDRGAWYPVCTMLSRCVHTDCHHLCRYAIVFDLPGSYSTSLTPRTTASSDGPTTASPFSSATRTSSARW